MRDYQLIYDDGRSNLPSEIVQATDPEEACERARDRFRSAEGIERIVITRPGVLVAVLKRDNLTSEAE